MRTHPVVMPGLDPGIHSVTVAIITRRGMDCRIKSGNDDMSVAQAQRPDLRRDA